MSKTIITETTPETTPAPKKRGRPAKVKTPETTPAPKKRGRPAKIKTPETTPAVTTEKATPKGKAKRGRGRPPRFSTKKAELEVVRLAKQIGAVKAADQIGISKPLMTKLLKKHNVVIPRGRKAA